MKVLIDASARVRLVVSISLVNGRHRIWCCDRDRRHQVLRLRRTAARLRDVDGDATVERLALVPMKSQSVSHEAWSCGGCDLLGCGFIGWRDELCHRLDLHVAVLQLPLIILFQQHRTDQPDD